MKYEGKARDVAWVVVGDCVSRRSIEGDEYGLDKDV